MLLQYRHRSININDIIVIILQSSDDIVGDIVVRALVLSDACGPTRLPDAPFSLWPIILSASRTLLSHTVRHSRVINIVFRSGVCSLDRRFGVRYPSSYYYDLRIIVT